MRKWLAFTLIFIFAAQAFAQESAIPLKNANIDLEDKASLQRGAKYFVNYCAACHSLKYVRYNRMAQDIGLVDEDGVVYQNLLKDNLMFTDAKVGDEMLNAMSEGVGMKWFGVPPPDLSLEARVRGADWIYTYLTSFYHDESKTWGTNNLLYPDVAMPNVLEKLQGIRIPIYRTEIIPYEDGTKEATVIDYLETLDGGMTEYQFNSVARDIVNFLTFMSEPVKLEREHLGIYVLVFLAVLLVLTYLLKKDFWKDV